MINSWTYGAVHWGLGHEGWAIRVMLSFVQAGNHFWWPAIWGWKSGEDVKEQEPSLTYGILVGGSTCWIGKWTWAKKGFFSIKPSSTKELLKFEIWCWPHTQPQINLLLQGSCLNEFSEQMLPLPICKSFLEFDSWQQQWDNETKPNLLRNTSLNDLNLLFMFGSWCTMSVIYIGPWWTRNTVLTLRLIVIGCDRDWGCLSQWPTDDRTV